MIYLGVQRTKITTTKLQPSDVISMRKCETYQFLSIENTVICEKSKF
jgi:hypothetical protein